MHVRARTAAVLRRLANRIHEQPACNVQLVVDKQRLDEILQRHVAHIVDGSTTELAKDPPAWSPPWRRPSDYRPGEA